MKNQCHFRLQNVVQNDVDSKNSRQSEFIYKCGRMNSSSSDGIIHGGHQGGMARGDGYLPRGESSCDVIYRHFPLEDVGRDDK